MTPTSSIKRFVTRVALVAGLGAGLAFAMPVSSASAQRGDRASQAERGQARGHHRGHGHRRGHGIQRMLRELELTDNQQAQVRAIMESARERRQELRGEGRSAETREAMRTLHQETRQLVLDVLTPEQKAKMEELRGQHQERRLDRRVTRMTEKLSLSETQATRIRSILEAAAEQRRALRNGSEAGTERRQAMQTLRERTKAAVDAVLTAEQRTALEAHRAEHEGRRGRHGRRGQRGEARGQR